MVESGKSSLNILYICQHFSTPRTGTTGTRAYEFAKRLVRRGHHVTVLTGVYALQKPTHTSQPFVQFDDEEGIRVIWVNIVSSTHLGFFSRMWNFLRFAAVGVFVVIFSRYDVVVGTSPPLTVGFPLFLARWFRGKPVVLEVRDLWPDFAVAMGIISNKPLIRFAKWFENLVYENSTRIIALAPGIMDSIAKTGYPKEQIALIPNGCDLELFQSEDVGQFESGDLRLIYAGAHGHANGLDSVIDAALELQRREESGIRFILVGDGSQKDRLVKRARDLHLTNLEFHAPIPKQDVAVLFRNCHVGLQILSNISAFQYATSPNKFCDYISAGLPVLINYPGWLADLVNHYECGIEVKSQDANEFADAVIWLNRHPDTAKKMRRHARLLAENVFDRDTLAHAFITVIEEAGNHVA